jgi:hypothetical protein
MYLDYTQLVLLSAASLRDDGAIASSHDLKNGTARTAVERLLSVGLIEEIPAGGSHVIWRRDPYRGPIGLRITKKGLAAILADDATLWKAAADGSRRRSKSESAPQKPVGQRKTAKAEAPRNSFRRRIGWT